MESVETYWWEVSSISLRIGKVMYLLLCDHCCVLVCSISFDLSRFTV